MKRISVLLIAIALFTSCKNNYFHKNTGVEIKFAVNRSIFPEEWLNSEIRPQAKGLQYQYRDKVLNVINTALQKYPVEIISNNLKTIYVLKELKFYNVNYGGTSSLSSVYLVDNFYTPFFIEQTFHHEFSAILKTNFNFDTLEFKKLIADSVYYGKGGLDALKTGGSSTYFDYNLIEKGFLSEYGSSCIDEDLSSIAEQLFSPQYEFWYIYDNYPVMRNKIKFVIDFYNSIDTTFNEKYFRSFETENNNERYSLIED